MEYILGIRTALGVEHNAWTGLNAMVMKRHSSCAAQIYYPTMIPLKMYPFDAIQVIFSQYCLITIMFSITLTITLLTIKLNIQNVTRKTISYLIINSPTLQQCMPEKRCYSNAVSCLEFTQQEHFSYKACDDWRYYKLKELL